MPWDVVKYLINITLFCATISIIFSVVIYSFYPLSLEQFVKMTWCAVVWKSLLDHNSKKMPWQKEAETKKAP